jgi:hypothetical protein
MTTDVIIKICEDSLLHLPDRLGAIVGSRWPAPLERISPPVGIKSREDNEHMLKFHSLLYPLLLLLLPLLMQLLC